MVDGSGLGSSVNAARQSVQRTNQQTNQANARLNADLVISKPIEAMQDSFASQALTKHANNLAKVKDQVSQAISTIQAADNALTEISYMTNKAYAVILQAQNTPELTERTGLADQYNQIRGQIDNIAADANFGGTNLIGPLPNNLSLALNDEGTTLTLQSTDSSSAALGIAARTFVSDADVEAALADISGAEAQIRSNASSLSSNTNTLQNRMDFTENLANTLEQGAENLTQANLSEEAASLLSLQTRQALSANTSTIATNNERAVLGLFG